MDNWLLKQTQLSRQRPALYTADTMLTFEALAEEVKGWAEKIHSLALPAQSFIGLVGPNTKATYELILACQQLGHPVALFNFRLSPAELNQQLNDAKPTVLLIDDTLSQQPPLTLASGPILTFSALADRAGLSYEPVATFEADQVADIMYTSGSTGRPKGVLQTFGNHFYSAIGTGLNFKLTQDDAWICTVPLCHISGLSILMRSLVYGLAVYLEPRFDPDHLNALLQHSTATIISVVPYMLKQLLAKLPTDAHYQPNFKGLFLGGGPIDTTTLQRCQSRNIPVVQSYGMTETASNVVALNFKDATRKLGSSGQALFPVRLRIATNGEIQLKSPTLAKGYYQQTEKFHGKFTSDHWFKTGDIGRLDEEGYLYVLGRADTMFISGGENIFPNEIETCYSHYPGIKEILVTHQPSAKWGAVPVALVVTDRTCGLAIPALKTYGRQRLAHYKVPVAFYRVPKLPKTGNGKIDYRQLKTIDFSKLNQMV